VAHVAALPVRWWSAAFDPLLRAVADDRARALFANLARRTAYAPYDGGADAFFGSVHAVSRAKAAWAGWLSTMSSGL